MEYLDLPLHSVSLNITETGKLLSIEQWDFIDSEMLITLFLKNQNKKIMYRIANVHAERTLVLLVRKYYNTLLNSPCVGRFDGING